MWLCQKCDIIFEENTKNYDCTPMIHDIKYIDWVACRLWSKESLLGVDKGWVYIIITVTIKITTKFP